ncbi:hypothetical protein SG34_012960 [Thalassomonas viridans]|nr:hypothetical protein [Thalassomonas viridans]WDE07718.1 hypothetical protein SG34_012960 [Thalassomonas viridans]
MNPAQFNQLITDTKYLTDKQARYLEKLLQGDDPIKHIIDELEQRMVDKPECPH